MIGLTGTPFGSLTARSPISVYHGGMNRIDVPSARGGYPILVAPGLVPRLGELLAGEGLASPRALVSDVIVGPLHGRRLAASLGVGTAELGVGEAAKAWPAVEALCQRWLDDGLDRSASVLAVGGGVVTDTTGFAAAIYLRGIDWVAVPTTLLAMVDAAVGGKTGVNLTAGKNLVGSFWPPRLVVADTATLATLPARELRAGLAEAVKAAWIGDRGLLELVPAGNELEAAPPSPEAWQVLVTRAAAVKVGIVATDEHEGGRRKALNLGHTFGHALEAATSYRRFLHGEAVAWGLIAAARLGSHRRLLSAAGEAALRAAVDRLGPLPPVADLDPEAVCAFIAVDKKRDAAGVGWVLPTDDGVMLDQRVEHAEAVEVLRELQRG